MWRVSIIWLCLLVEVGAAIAVFCDPQSDGRIAARIALIAFIIACVLAGRRLWRRPPAAYLLLVVMTLALIPGILLERNFRDIDTAAFVFHAKFGIAGTPFLAFEKSIRVALITVAVFLLALWHITAWARLSGRHLVLLALVLIPANPLLRTLAYDRMTYLPSDLRAQLHTTPVPAQLSPEILPDIVMIYLEGTDRQFADAALWPGLYDPLDALAAQGTSFTRIGQMRGTGWSVAGMVATQCGVPLLPNGIIYHNDLNYIDRFLPRLTCLGDVLADKGYATALVLGGSQDFGGIAAFYETHGVENVTDAAVLRSRHEAATIAAADIGWVLDDELVFAEARAIHTELARGSAPLALIIETYGPHDARGLLSRRCTPDGQARRVRDTAASLDCLLGLTTGFLTDLRARHAKLRPGRPLKIVVMSDHLNHDGALPVPAADYAGFNTVILLGDDLPESGAIGTPGTMVDVYPTLLEWLGFAGPGARAGLGRSLWNKGTTLSAEHGLATVNAMLRTDSELGDYLWSEPSGPLSPDDPVRAETVLEHAESG